MSRHTRVERDYTGHGRTINYALHMTWLLDPSLCPFLVMLWGLGNSMCNPGLSAFSADIAKVKIHSSFVRIQNVLEDTDRVLRPF